MRRRSPSSSHRNGKSRRSQSEDRRSGDNRIGEEKDERRKAWLIQQQRERDHEILKKKMILEYELKRAALLNNDGKKRSENYRRSRSRSRTRNSDHRERNRNEKPIIMSEKLDSQGGSEPLFRGPSTSTRPTESELRKIKVDIHRNIQGPVDTRTDLHREIVNPEEVTVKRREDEGQKPLFYGLNLPQLLTENEEQRSIRFQKDDENNQLRKSRSKSVDSSSRIPSRSRAVRSPSRSRAVRSLSRSRSSSSSRTVRSSSRQRVSRFTHF